MAKEKKQKQINLEEITALTKELFHAHYAGDLERWFDYLCPDSIYLGTGEPMLFGGSAIREHFKGFEGEAADVVSEEYYPVPLGETAAQVCGRIPVDEIRNGKRSIIAVSFPGFSKKYSFNSSVFMPSTPGEPLLACTFFMASHRFLLASILSNVIALKASLLMSSIQSAL